MDIVRLEEFLKLIECGGFRPAATELFLSQPTLSRHIAEIESTLGKLFVIRESPPVLTAAGAVFEQYAKRFVILYEQMQKELDSVDSAADYRIKFHDVSEDKRLSSFFESVHQILKDKLVGAEFSLVSPLSTSIVDAVVSHEIDVGVIEVLLRGDHVLMPPSESVDFVPLPGTRQPLAVFCSRSGPLSELDFIKPRHLASAHLILRSVISPQDSRQSLCMFANLLSEKAAIAPLCTVSDLPLNDVLATAGDDTVFITGASSATLVPHKLYSSFVPKTPKLKNYRVGICLVMRKNWKELAERINCKYNIF